MTNWNDLRRKFIYGVGINDVDYITSTTINGKTVTCPYYRTWHNMLKRCYDSKCHEVQPNYRGCSVDPRWHRFSVFRKWMGQQRWRGKELDKDILKCGNKVYSPENCMFVTRAINSLLARHYSGGRTRGYHWDQSSKKYRVELHAYGKKRYVGVYSTSEAAARAYRRAKSAHIAEVALQQPQPLQNALLRHSELLACET